jgi:hypothetical protein
MENFERWRAALTSTQSGRIWWANLQYDFNVGNVDPSMEKEFRGGIEKVGTSPSPTEAVKFLWLQNPLRFNLKSTRAPKSPEQYSTVITVEEVAEFNIKWDETGYQFDEKYPDRLWDNLGHRIKNDHFINFLRENRSFFWCSPTRSVKQVRDSTRSKERQASELRNQLGLSHHGAKQRLLQIDIPKAMIAGKIICAPTTLDVLPGNVAFVPCHDESTGWTLNLSTYERGIEEVVIESLPFNRDYIVTKIGEVADGAPPLDFDLLERRALQRIGRRGGRFSKLRGLASKVLGRMRSWLRS